MPSPSPKAALSRTSLIYHFGLEGLGEISLGSATDGDDASTGGIEGDVRLSGSSMELGEFEISIVDREWLEIERRLPSRRRSAGADVFVRVLLQM